MESATRSQILNQAVCVLLSANDLGEGMNSSVPELWANRVNSRGDWFFILGGATSIGEEE